MVVVFSFSTPYQRKCVTKISPHWSSTMDPVCAKPDLPEMMHPGPSSRLSSADPDIRCVSLTDPITLARAKCRRLRPIIILYRGFWYTIINCSTACTMRHDVINRLHDLCLTVSRLKYKFLLISRSGNTSKGDTMQLWGEPGRCSFRNLV